MGNDTRTTLPRIITLTTDFGLQDHFVGVMKGVILNINPEARLVDISHEVSAHDPLDGAFTLAQSYPYFPSGAIHLVVVDPGVGSERRAILVRTAKYLFVAPDNGVLSPVYDREPGFEVRHIVAEHFFLKPLSNTFHGRDVFAPVAAWLSRGTDPSEFGPVITDFVRIDQPHPQSVSPGLIRGSVIKIDRFGNIITNITRAHLEPPQSGALPPSKLVVNGREISHWADSYAAGRGREPFIIMGSSGFLEIAVNQGSAAEVLKARRGTEVTMLRHRRAYRHYARRQRVKS